MSSPPVARCIVDHAPGGFMIAGGRMGMMTMNTLTIGWWWLWRMSHGTAAMTMTTQVK